jgi:quaternary ammonium compound-resistance protein SugE
VGWPLGLKLSQTASHKIFWIVFAVISMAASGVFLWLAQKTIPMGTAYAVWTGIGTVGAFITGILLFKDPYPALRVFSASLIILGIIGLRFSSL